VSLPERTRVFRGCHRGELRKGLRAPGKEHRDTLSYKNKPYRRALLLLRCAINERDDINLQLRQILIV
jgi:hypothetical protein